MKYGILIFFLVVLPSDAFAQRWIGTVEKDDFGDAHVGMATVVGNGRVFGLRCENGKVPTLIYATLEQWADNLGVIPAKLLLRVDDGEVIEKRAVLDAYERGIGKSVRVLAPGDHNFPVLGKIMRSRKRLSVAVELLGEKFEKARFSTVGATSAFRKIWRYCGSKHGTYEKPKP